MMDKNTTYRALVALGLVMVIVGSQQAPATPESTAPVGRYQFSSDERDFGTIIDTTNGRLARCFYVRNDWLCSGFKEGPGSLSREASPSGTSGPASGTGALPRE